MSYCDLLVHLQRLGYCDRSHDTFNSASALISNPDTAQRADYGFDAPGLASLALAVNGQITVPAVAWISGGLIIAASLLSLALGLSLAAYGRIGKPRVRDALLDLVAWARSS